MNIDVFLNRAPTRIVHDLIPRGVDTGYTLKRIELDKPGGHLCRRPVGRADAGNAAWHAAYVSPPVVTDYYGLTIRWIPRIAMHDYAPVQVFDVIVFHVQLCRLVDL